MSGYNNNLNNGSVDPYRKQSVTDDEDMEIGSDSEILELYIESRVNRMLGTNPYMPVGCLNVNETFNSNVAEGEQTYWTLTSPWAAETNQAQIDQAVVEVSSQSDSSSEPEVETPVDNTQHYDPNYPYTTVFENGNMADSTSTFLPTPTTLPVLTPIPQLRRVSSYTELSLRFPSSATLMSQLRRMPSYADLPPQNPWSDYSAIDLASGETNLNGADPIPVVEVSTQSDSSSEPEVEIPVDNTQHYNPNYPYTTVFENGNMADPTSTFLPTPTTLPVLTPIPQLRRVSSYTELSLRFPSSATPMSQLCRMPSYADLSPQNPWSDYSPIDQASGETNLNGADPIPVVEVSSQSDSSSEPEVEIRVDNTQHYNPNYPYMTVFENGNMADPTSTFLPTPTTLPVLTPISQLRRVSSYIELSLRSPSSATPMPQLRRMPSYADLSPQNPWSDYSAIDQASAETNLNGADPIPRLCVELPPSQMPMYTDEELGSIVFVRNDSDSEQEFTSPPMALIPRRGKSFSDISQCSSNDEPQRKKLCM